MAILAMSAFAFTFNSCSSDDDSASENLSGEEIFDYMGYVLNDYIEKNKLYINEDFTCLMLPVESETEAREVVQKITLEEWNGQDYTFQIPDNYGRIRIVEGSEEGVYYTLAFNVTDLKPFTLQLCTPGYPEKENPSSSFGLILSGALFWCKDCGYRWTHYGENVRTTCSKCGSKNLGCLWGVLR